MRGFTTGNVRGERVEGRVVAELHRRVSLHGGGPRGQGGPQRRYHGDQGFTWVLKCRSVTMDDLRSPAVEIQPSLTSSYVLLLASIPAAFILSEENFSYL